MKLFRCHYPHLNCQNQIIIAVWAAASFHNVHSGSRYIGLLLLDYHYAFVPDLVIFIRYTRPYFQPLIFRSIINLKKKAKIWQKMDLDKEMKREKGWQKVCDYEERSTFRRKI